MKALIDTTNARRAKQQAYNRKHHITPKTVLKAERETITDVLGLAPASSRVQASYDVEDLHETAAMLREDRVPLKPSKPRRDYKGKLLRTGQRSLEGLSMTELISELEKEMFAAAENLEFERAARLRDQLYALEHPDQQTASEKFTGKR